MRNIYNLTPAKLKDNIGVSKRVYEFPGALHKNKVQTKKKKKKTQDKNQPKFYSVISE